MAVSQIAPADSNDEFPIAIIGSGFAGIGMAIQLKRAGIDSFTMFERASDVGGTWRNNTYPGAACDVPSHVYSFSFEPNPSWSRAFAMRATVLASMEQSVAIGSLPLILKPSQRARCFALARIACVRRSGWSLAQRESLLFLLLPWRAYFGVRG